MLTITPKEVTRALTLCKQVTERRNTIPVLAMIRLTGKGSALKVQATDLDNYLTVEAECDCTEQLDVLLRPDVLAHFARHAQGLITIKREGDNVKLTSGDISAEFFDVITVDDWPEMRQPDGATATISEADFVELLRHTRTFISTEETRYYLNGVYLHAPEGKLIGASTDGRRIAESCTGSDWFDRSHILPTKAAKIIAIASKKGNGALEVMTDNDVNRCAMRFVAQGWKLTCKTIDGTFPDYSRVFPKFEAPTIVVTIAQAAAMALSRGGDRAARIDPTEGKITTVGRFDGHIMTAPCTGRGGAFALNLSHLQDVLRRHEVVRLEGDGDQSPFWMRTDNAKLRMVIMPMRV